MWCSLVVQGVSHVDGGDASPEPDHGEPARWVSRHLDRLAESGEATDRQVGDYGR